MAPRARDLGIDLDVRVGEAPEVRGDPIWLTQLLLNLLDNALRHTPPAAGDAWRSTRRCARAAPRVSVADTGEGIAPEHLPHLFERFYRADAARGRAAGGVGLGLAICDWVARAHGGRLEVASTVGSGTTIDALAARAARMARTRRHPVGQVLRRHTRMPFRPSRDANTG